MNLTVQSWCLDQLRHLGWLDNMGSGGVFEDSLAAYQEFFGLEPTGELDGPTQRSLREYRFCALPDVLESREEARWRKNKLTIAVTGNLPALSKPQRLEAIALALGWWSEIIDLSFTISDDGITADITMGAGSIDGAGGTLAWSELPNGNDRPLQQKYDSAERFVVAEQMTGGTIDLARVICHEVGHALGLTHLRAGCLMAPTVSASIRKPQAGDVEAILALGYAPARRQPLPPPPGPPPLPPPAAKRKITIEVESNFSAARVLNIE